MTTTYLHQVWREVSRHLDIAESSRSIHAVLAGALGVRFLVVSRWDDENGVLRAVGGGGLASSPGRSTLAGPTAAAVRSWASEATISAWHDRSANRVARALIPEGTEGPALVSPLVTADGLQGVVVFGGLTAVFPGVEELVEAFAIALRNDARLNELARVREAAEADRQALLSRLGRQALTDGVVGAEGGLREVIARVAQVASTDVPVLLLGETGSGKEVISRILHERSGRQRGPFLRVNCGAIPKDLVDTELFGHERGAFTGALATRRGWFERADGGTLFLDEVGELPPAAQVRLLRVLQDGSFQRVGGQETRTADVRVVAATHQNMERLVTAGAFREDLWYRIGVFPIRIPALRERPGDIPTLATHFAASAGARLFGVSLCPDASDLRMLTAYGWPGNVRELAAVIERAAILGDGKHLDVATSLGVLGSMAVPKLPEHPLQANPAANPSGMLRPGINIAEIEAALRASRGRIEGVFGAARRLGVNPHTLRARMRKYGIDWALYRESAPDER